MNGSPSGRKKFSALPTLLTLGNILSGFGAMCLALKARGLGEAQDLIPYYTTLTTAGWLIMLALVFDALDGSVARATSSASDFGLELDSLADMTSFGIAPALLAREVFHQYTSKLLWATPYSLFVLVAVFPMCTALRLARFNVESDLDESSHKCFTGLPSPGAAGALVSWIILHAWLAKLGMLGYVNFTILPIALQFAVPLLAFLMISPVRYVHMGNRLFRSPKTFPFIAFMTLFVALTLRFPEIVVVVVFTLYVASGWTPLLFDRAVGALELDHS